MTRAFLAFLLAAVAGVSLIAQVPAPVDVRKVNNATVPPAICQNESLRTPGTASISSSASDVEMVALVSSQIVYVCDLEVIAADDVTVTFKSTNSSCGSPTTLAVLPLVIADASSINLERPGGGFVILKTAASKALCIGVGSNVAVRVNFVYVQMIPPS